jgi:predicted nucleic-acid-binding protein
METVYVYTNVFLRYLLKDDLALYRRAEVIFDKAKKAQVKLLVPNIVIFEIAFVLKSVYKETKEEVIQKIESLIASRYLFIDDAPTLRQAITLYKNSSNSFVDCFLIAKSQAEGYKLFTFDKKLSVL